MPPRPLNVPQKPSRTFETFPRWGKPERENVSEVSKRPPGTLRDLSRHFPGLEYLGEWALEALFCILGAIRATQGPSGTFAKFPRWGKPEREMSKAALLIDVRSL